MKTKFKLSCLFLAALMLFSLTACGKDNPEPSSTSEGTEQTKPPVEAGSGTTIHTNLWDLTYDEADGWVYEEDDLHDDEDSIGTPSAGFRENKADLSQNSITRRYALFRCFRPVFSTRGSGRGSMSITLTVHHKRPFYFHNTRSSSQSQLPKMLQRLFASHAHPHQNAGYEPDILFPACH